MSDLLNGRSLWPVWGLAATGLGAIAGALAGALDGTIVNTARIAVGVASGAGIVMLVGGLAQGLVFSRTVAAAWWNYVVFTTGAICGGINGAIGSFLLALLIWKIILHHPAEWMVVGTVLGTIFGAIGAAIVGTVLVRRSRESMTAAGDS